MSDDWAPGPGREDRGTSATPGPSPRPVAKRKGAGPQQRLHEHWMDRMVTAAFRKQCSVVEARPVFNANVKYLREQRGLSYEEITALIDTFAEQVAGNRIDVKGKSAWRVFMKVWHTLGGNAAQRGLRERMENSTEEDWLSR